MRGPLRHIALLGGELWRIAVLPAIGGVEHDTFVVVFEPQQPVASPVAADGVEVAVADSAT